MIRIVDPAECAPQLAQLLRACVEDGASVSFMAGLTQERAEAFWRKETARVVFVVGDFDGTASLLLDQPENQPHRGELAKMLVHPRARRQGLGRVLFEAVETEARLRGKTLLTFDTMSGGAAERLYLRCGCTKSGEIPGYALWPHGGPPGATSVFFKLL